MYVLHCTVLYVAVVQMYCMLLLLFSRWVISDSMRHHRLQHAKLLFPLLPPGICSDSHRLSQWCHPNISSSVIPFSSCPQSFPVSGSLPKSWLSVMSGWPSGLRRQTQDSIFPLLGLLVSEWRRGFESHFWQDSVLFLAHMCLSSCFSTFILPRLEYPLLFCSWVLSTSKDSPHQQLHPGLYSGRSWYPWKSH